MWEASRKGIHGYAINIAARTTAWFIVLDPARNLILNGNELAPFCEIRIFDSDDYEADMLNEGVHATDHAWGLTKSNVPS